jgi:hypothetical protein
MIIQVYLRSLSITWGDSYGQMGFSSLFDLWHCRAGQRFFHGSSGEYGVDDFGRAIVCRCHTRVWFPPIRKDITMGYFRGLLILLSLAGVGYVVYDFIQHYLSYSGDRYTRFLYAFKSSYTLIWSRFVVFVGLAVNILVGLADYANLPGVGAAISNYLTPTTVSLLMVGIAVVTEFARRRTL